MKKYIVIGAAALVLLLAGLYFVFSSQVELRTEIPGVFSEQKIQWINFNGMTFIESQPGGSVYPITHDAAALYVLSGTKDVIRHYYVDKANKELVIEQKASKKTRDGTCFQLITIPAEKYQPIVEDNKLKIKIKFNYLNNKSIYLLYDLQTKTSQTMDTNLVSK